ncbi:ATP-binding cassette domain-containing protein [Georgenia sp. MJ206]|uniref:ABC transporter ATP-binding protein n=1 Tax=Georgenia wangjunii TaxID=3117730 RepID=UPI002F26479A
MIEFRSVSKRFDDGTEAVVDLDLILPAHRTTVLVGSSGSGKTTILRMINRMVDPTAGTIEIDGVDLRERAPVALRRGIGYVMQSAGLLPHRRVLDNIITVLRLTKVPRTAARERGLALMDVVGLDRSLAGRYPSQLSGGQQQRVGVARALATDPNILLMDEPFGAVDPIVRTELQDELLRVQERLAKTIVFVTHDIDEAFRLGDHVVILEAGGRIAQQGTPAEILAAPASDFVASFIGADRGRRTLHVVETGGRSLVVDSAGRPAGVLEPRPGSVPAARPPR